jgi:hypothetical protein
MSNMIQTPNNTISPVYRMPTCPPAPGRPDDITQSLVQKFDSCPRVPDLPSSPDADVASSIKRLMPRPRFVEMPYWRLSIEHDTAYALHSKAGMTIPESLLQAFQSQDINREDSDGRKAKRVRRTSLLDGLPPRRASFAGAA